MTLSPAHNGQTRLNVGDFDTTSIIRDEYSLEVNPVRFHGRNKYEKQQLMAPHRAQHAQLPD